MSDTILPELPEMPFLRNLGLLLTYKCQVSCAHCILQAGPHRTEKMTLQDAFDWIQQTAAYRNGHVKVLALTGGEPFYDLGALKMIADHGLECGLFVSAVTNAFWASSTTRAVEILKRLKSIRLLSISTDTYHQKSIPFERVVNAVTAARQCGVGCSISVCTDSEEDTGYQQILKEVSALVPKEAIFTAITFPVGRALEQIRNPRYATTPEPPISACCAGASPIIFQDGRVIACIGPVIDLKPAHPLFLGDLKEESLEEILDRAELNAVLHAIRLWGPRKLIDLAKESGLGRYLPASFIKDSVCNACYCLMKTAEIVQFLQELAGDREFVRRVTYGRVYYLNEPFAAARLQPECSPAHESCESRATSLIP